MEMDKSTAETFRPTESSAVTLGHVTMTSPDWEAESQPEVLSIIVWCVGGILLVSLLALLGRIILARRPDPLDPDSHPHRQQSLFSIYIDTQPSHDTYPPSRDTLDLVSGTDAPATDSPQQLCVPPYRGPGHTAQQQQQHQQLRHYHQQQQRQQQQLQQPQIQQGNVTEYRTQNVPVTDSPTAQPTRATPGGTGLPGSLVSINGVIIRPPPYNAVVTSDVPLPSVVVGRNQRLPPRRLMMSL